MNTSIYRYITAIFISFIILSCRGTTDNTGTEGQVVVKINLLGIIETQDTSVSRVRAISAAYIAEVAYNKDFNLVATIVPEVPVLKINSRKSLNPSALTVTPQPPTTRPIDANVKYLVMVFDENGSRITAQEKIYDSTNQSNTANQMILDAGKNYTFVAISYNTATAPTFNAAATTLNNVINTVAVGNTTDYLYFNSGPVNIVYGQQNYINITFKHVNSNVSLSIDATAELGRITSIIAHIEGTGSVNLAANGTGTPGTAAVYDKAFTFPIINTQIVNSSPVLVSSAGSTHTINLVSVSLNGGERRADIPPIVIPAGTFRRGVNYKVKLSFQSTGIIAGGLIWARGNLAYDWGNKIYYNRYYPQESGSDYKDTDYWNYATDDTNPLAPKMIITSHSDIWNWSTNVYYFTDGTNENSDSKIPLNDPCKEVNGECLL